MKLCNILLNGSITGALVTDSGLIPLVKTMDEIIADYHPEEIMKFADSYAGEPIVPEAAEFANVTNAQKLLCVGLNYKKHAAETGGTPPERPVYFSKFNDCLTPHKADIPLPDFHRCYDYEAELVIVMGKTAWNIGEDEDPADYIFGYTAGNDLSARDCQFLSNQWLSGKSLPMFGPAGPYVVTKDCFDPEETHRIVCRVNGITAQDDETSDMLFTCRQIVADASKFFRLNPGDLIYTGTPSGVILGKAKGTRVWLKPGDTVEVEIDGVCTLQNKLIR